MARYAMIIDVSKCSGCGNCYLACKNEFCGTDRLPFTLAQPYMGHKWIDVRVKEKGQAPKLYIKCVPLTCMHCENAPCAEAARDGAVYRRPDGIVLIDPRLAIGQKEIVDACPYGVVFWNDLYGVPQKCTMCAHLLDQGGKPRCVEACPTRALVFGDLHDPASEVAKIWVEQEPEILHHEYGLKGNVRYIGLTKKLITGTVCLGDNEEGAENVKVSLASHKEIRETKTDFFGAFAFTGLDANTEYQLTVEAAGYGVQTVSVVTHKDVCLGKIFLVKKAGE